MLIIILAVILAVFSLPLVSAFSMRPESITSIFELMFFLFTLFWMLAWGAGVFVMFALLCALLFIREVLIVRSNTLTIQLEWFGVGVAATYQKQYISGLHTCERGRNGNRWRGSHLVFNYFDVPVHVGSGLDEERQQYLIDRIVMAFDGKVPEKLTNLPADTDPIQEAAASAEPADETSAGLVTEDGQAVRSSSSLLLILANLVPVAGVLFLDWQIGDLMLLFWIESAIIGVFNAVKMFVVGRWTALFYVPFFIGHFGGFMAVHLLFVFTLFINNPEEQDLASAAAVFMSLWPAILSLFISHGFSFLVNFVGRKEYVDRTMKQQMSEPYKRVIVMHITILLGGFLVMTFTSTLAPLILLIGLKLITDLYAHHSTHSDSDSRS